MMFLKQTKRPNNRIYLSVVHNYREGGVTKSKTIRKLGYLDAIAKELDLAEKETLTYLKAQISEEEVGRKLKKVSPVIELETGKQIEEANRKNIGHAVLNHYYNLLEFEKFFTSKDEIDGIDGTKLSDVFKLLIYCKTMGIEGGKGEFSGALKNKQLFSEEFDFELDDIRKSLELFSKYKEELMEWAFSKLSALKPERDTSINYCCVLYFVLEGATIDDPYLLQLAVLMDRFGVPISFKEFKGHEKNPMELLSGLEGFRQRFDLNRIVMVSNRSFHTSEIVPFSTPPRSGYIFAQSVRNGSANFKKWIRNKEGYRSVGNNFRIKSRRLDLPVFFEDPNGQLKKSKVPVKQVVYFSPDYSARSSSKREMDIERALYIIANPSAYDPVIFFSSTRYIKGFSADPVSNRVTSDKMSLDIDRVEEDESLVGYNAMVTSELNRSSEDLANVFRTGFRVNDVFTPSKREFAFRGFESRLSGSFTISFAVFLIQRLIKSDLECLSDFKGAQSCTESAISETLRLLSGSQLKGEWYSFSYRSELSDALGRLVGLDLTRQFYSLSDIKELCDSK